MPSRSTILTCLGLCALGIIHIAIVRGTARHATLTLDEVNHLPAGLANLETRSFRIYPHNPPLARMVAAAAAQSAGPVVDYGGTWQRHRPPSPWLFGLEFQAANPTASYFVAFDRGRMTIAAWSALALVLIFLWGRWWFGARSGWLAATLWALSPNVIAHSGLVTTDLAATSLMLLANLSFARWLQRPSVGRAVVTGICLGLAQLTKFSAIGLLAIYPVWGLIDCLLPSVARDPARLSWRRLCMQMALLLAIMIAIINFGYLGEGFGTPLGQLELYSETLTRPRTTLDGPPPPTSNALLNQRAAERINRFTGTLLGRVPIPLPYHYVAGFDEQKFEAEGRYQMYLAGELRSGGANDGRSGWWYYYLYALGVKVPESTWILLLMSFTGGLAFGLGVPQRLLPWMLLTLAPILSMSLFTDINLGIRYILPAFPTLFLLAGTAAQPGRPRWWTILILLAVAWNAVSVFRVHPHELSYFNAVSGGPATGRFHLIDSNLDWGQDLGNLAEFRQSHPQWKDLHLAYMGSVPPERVGIESYRLAPRDLRYVPPELRLPWENANDPWSSGPQPGRYAISVNFERGMQNYLPCPQELLPRLRAQRSGALVPGTAMLYNPAQAYSYFQELTPTIVPEIGYSLLLYDVSFEDANRVRAKLRLPLLPAR